MGYSRLEPGRELEVREYISFQRGRDGFCELIECSVDELLERKAESIVREKELCQRIDAAVEVFVDEVYLFFKYYYSAQFLYKCWKRFRKYAAAMTAATQNIEECLRSETARLMLANSEFLILLNQAATDRAELAKLLHISETQMSHVTNVEAGHGLMRIGSSIIPFVNEFPRDGTLYRLMTTTPGDK